MSFDLLLIFLLIFGGLLHLSVIQEPFGQEVHWILRVFTIHDRHALGED